MQTRILNGFSHFPATTRAGAQQPIPAGDEDPAACPTGLRSARAAPVANLQTSDFVVKAKRLEESLRKRVATLQRRESRLNEKVQQLTEAAARAAKFAYHDELTGLPNRRLLTDRIKQAAANAQRQRRQVALLFLDLDGFKNINDTLGHAGGDKLLQQLARRLSDCVRITDTVSRYGGDEFVILLPELEDQKSAIAAAAKICSRLELPFIVDDAEITLTASIGLAVYPLDGSDGTDLIRQSDVAMYRHKARGPARPGIHVRQRTDAAAERR